MSRYEHDPRVRYEHGGYTVNSNGSRVRVLPYEGGHRWGVFTGPPGSTVLNALRNAPEYRSADEALRALLGDPHAAGR